MWILCLRTSPLPGRSANRSRYRFRAKECPIGPHSSKNSIDISCPFTGQWLVQITPTDRVLDRLRSESASANFERQSVRCGQPHVTIDSKGVVIAVCHLRHGSVEVRGGQHMLAGAIVGRCGNSGSSTEPHVHLHAMGVARSSVPRRYGCRSTESCAETAPSSTRDGRLHCETISRGS